MEKAKLTDRVKPKKALGQNFLIDDNIKRKIVDSLDIVSGDLVIEVGPGMGAITKYLLDMDIDYIGIEIDRTAVEYLNTNFTFKENQQIVQADVLNKRVKVSELTQGRKAKLIGNLPYNISSQIIFKVFENSDLISSAVFMLQREMADRLYGKIDTKDYGVITLATQLYGRCTKLFDVSPNCFYPKPKVTSSVVKFDFDNQVNLDLKEKKSVMRIVKTAFNMRRKTVRNAVSSILGENQKLSKADLVMEFEKQEKEFFNKRA